MKTKIRILHVDDNVHDRKLVKDALQKEHHGFEIVEADSRMKFEQYLAENDFDLVLSDFNILGFDGLQVLRAVQEINPDLPVIIVTGTGSEEIAIQAMKLGAADYVIKSVKHIQGLEPAIRAVLKSKKNEKNRKKAEDMLRESEAKFRNLFEHSPVGKSMTGIDGSLHVNKSFCDILGYSEEELRTKTWMEITYPDDIQYSIEMMQSLLEGRESKVRYEKRYIHKNGNIVWTDISIFLQSDKDGNPQFFITSLADITNRKRTEQELKESENRFRSIIENSKDGLIFFDGETRKILFGNKAMADMLGCNREDLVERSISSLHPLEKWKDIEQEFEKHITGELSVSTGIPIVRDNGTIFYADISSSVIILNGRSYMSAFFRDITERIHAESQLIIAKEKAEEGDRLKTAFLQNISHEIRTPMNAIVGFSGLLNNPNLLPKERENYTEIIINSSNQLLSIITDIINIATIEAGQENVQENVINLNSILNLLHAQFISKAKSKNILLNYTTFLHDNNADILTDGTKLTEILSNLISNALKFIKEGYVNYGYTLKEDNLEFYVEDTGIGVPPEMQEEIFIRFRQVETTANRVYGGSGLGLSICKAYVDIMGGKIWLTSEPGKGSVFYFSIPYKKANKEELAEKIPTRKINIDIEKPKTILIAEDEDYNFMLLEELLPGKYFNIIRAVNGFQAVEICKTNPQIDMVLMDLKMPVLNGFEATRLIKALRPGLPVIAQTAYSTDADKSSAIASGCCDFISKPFKHEQLLSKIEEYIVET